MSNLLQRLVALSLLIWFPLSFFLPPALVLIAIRWFQHGWVGILGGLIALAIAIPTGFTIILLELKTLNKRPLDVSGTLLVVAYNTAVYVAFRYFL